jgi:hypothetical protein
MFYRADSKEEAAQAMSPTTWRIISIQRNLHKEAAEWFEFAAKRSRSQAMLWHGYRSTPLQTLLQEGLDVRMSATGCAGRGIYLSESPSYSHEYTTPENERGERVLLLVKSCLGRVKDYGKNAAYGLMTNLVKPPPCEDDPSKRYDSVKYSQTGLHGLFGQVRTHNLHCLYSNALTYIAYIVRYAPKESGL